MVKSECACRHDQAAIGGTRAKVAMARSISAASRMLMGLTSTPTDGATAWIAANWPIPEGTSADPAGLRRVSRRRDFLEQLQPFAAQAVFELDESGGVAARPRQAVNEARCRPGRRH